MKKLFSVLLVSALFAACGNDGADNNDVEVKSAPITPGIDNVDGNIPDTGETIQLNRPLPQDSFTGTAADTLPRR